ncbi:MAG: TetR/AcrR family transcriptional regulator [Candidatus Sericytochromatia bacterium]
MQNSELKQLYPEFDELSPGQQRILAAALELFAERGYAATSTGAIAKQAGVAEGLIFKHFRSKKELFLKLVRPLALDVFFPISVRRIQKLLSQDYPHFGDLLEAILRERLAFALSHQRLLRMMIQEFWLHDELRATIFEKFQEQIYPYVERQFTHFRDLGEIRPMPFTTFIRLLLTSAMGLVITRVLLFPDAAWDDEAEIRQTVAYMVQGLAPANAQSGKDDQSDKSGKSGKSSSGKGAAT